MVEKARRNGGVVMKNHQKVGDEADIILGGPFRDKQLYHFKPVAALGKGCGVELMPADTGSCR